MSWFKKFVFVFCVICAVGILLFGFFFSACIISDWLPLRPDVICGLMLLAAIAIATVIELYRFYRIEKDDD